MSEKVSIITIFHGDKEFIPLIRDNYNSFLNKDDLELVVVDDGKQNLIKEFCDLENILYTICMLLCKFYSRGSDKYLVPKILDYIFFFFVFWMEKDL